MNTKRSVWLFLCVFITCFSCVYESYVPIDKASVPIDTSLLYTWENSENGDRYTISRQDDFRYNILAYNKSNNNYTKMQAYISKIESYQFLNVWNVDNENRKRKYSIMKIEKNDMYTLDILPLTSNITEQFSKSEDLRNFIKINMKTSFFYENTGHFKRTDKKYAEHLSNGEQLLFIANCEPTFQENFTGPREHRDKDVVICRSSIFGLTYTTTMYRKEHHEVKAYSFHRASESLFDIGTYKWINDSSILFKTINSKDQTSETYTLSGYRGTTQIVSNE